MSILPLAALQASELSVEQTKPYKLSEAEAKELLLPQKNENQSANTFSLNGFTLEFDTRRETVSKKGSDSFKVSCGSLVLS